MAARNFDACLKLTLQFEGGYVDHPADPGGATNLGITRRTLARWRGRPVSKAEVRDLSRKEAAEIYRKYYWNAVNGDDLPLGIDAAVFDHAVNSGPRAAVRMLQQALALKADGVIGSITLALVRACDSDVLLGELMKRRRSFLQRLKTFRVFGRGWTRRLIAVEGECRAMIGRRTRISTNKKGA
jgi:lysozyme family protein